MAAPLGGAAAPQNAEQVIAEVNAGKLSPMQVALAARVQAFFNDPEVWHALATRMNIPVDEHLQAAHQWRTSVEAFYRKANDVALQKLGQAVHRHENVFEQTNEIITHLETLQEENCSDAIKTIITHAIDTGNSETIQMLLRAGGKVGRLANTIATEKLLKSAREHNLNAIRCLLDAGLDVNSAGKEGETALMSGVFDTNTLRLLLSRHADVNKKDDHKRTALMTAAGLGSLNSVEILLNSGARVNDRDDSDMTALCSCAESIFEHEKHLQVLKTLIEHGAEFNIKDKEGRTPVIMAASCANSLLVQELLDRGVPIDERDNEGRTALIAGSYNSSVVELLLSRHADVNIRDNENMTALMWAALHANPRSVELLLDHGARINDVANNDRTALSGLITSWGEKKDLLPVLRILIGRGADLNKKDSLSQTPLISAAGNNHPELVEELVAQGASVNERDNQGQTAFMIAASKGYGEVLIKLIPTVAAAIAEARAGNITADSLALAARSYAFFNDDAIWYELAKQLHIPMSDNPPPDHPWKTVVENFYRQLNDFALNRLGPAIPRQENVFEQFNEIKKFLNGYAVREEQLRNTINGAIDIALERGQPGIIQILLQAGGRIAEAARTIATERLFTSATAGPSRNIAYLLDAGIPINSRNLYGRTALILAADTNNAGIVEELIARGASVNERDNTGQTALMIAASHGHVEVVKKLRTQDATQVNLQDNDHQSALTLAIRWGNIETIQELLARPDIDVNIRGPNNRTPLQSALSRPNIGAAKLLINHRNIDLVARDDDGRNALIIAASRGDLESTNLLIDHHADINAADLTGKTPLMYAAENGHVDVVKALMAHGAHIIAQDSRGQTALIRAVIMDQRLVVEELLRTDAPQLNIRDTENNRSALGYALLNGLDEIALRLQQRGARE